MEKILRNKHYLLIAVVLSVQAYVLYHLRIPILTRSISPVVLWHQNDPDHRMKIVSGKYVTFEQEAPNPLYKIIKRYKLDQIISNRENKPVTLIKRVGCGAGETLSVDANDYYYCNGIYLATAKREVAGKPIAPFRFNGTVPSGKLFVVGDSPGSYDSRVYGFVDRTRIKGVAWPLL